MAEMRENAETTDPGRVVWRAHEAAAASGYLPAQGWADLADQAWRLTLEHPERRAQLQSLALDYALHAISEADADLRLHPSGLSLRRRSS